MNFDVTNKSIDPPEDEPRADSSNRVRVLSRALRRRLPDDGCHRQWHNSQRRVRRGGYAVAVIATMSFVEQLGPRDTTVPAKLPMILKQFCKAAIRTQPYDLLKWSGSYFRALADGEEPPAKSRLEYPPPSTASGLTLGFLRVLLRQFGNYNKTLPIETISRRWDCLCLDRKDFDTIATIGGFRRACRVKKFLAVAVGLLSANLTETMIMICQLFTHEPDGGSAMIPLTLFTELYEYLAGLACDGKSTYNDRDETTERTKDSSVDRICSIVNSQDTDVDVNLNLGSTSKDDEVDSSKVDLSTELLEGTSLEGENIRREVEKEEEEEEDNDESSTVARRDPSSIDKDRKGDYTIEERFRGGVRTDANESDESIFSERERNTSVTYCPSVPGIGLGVPAQRVTNVTSWMLECAQLQEGMIGPRNIRHVNCPSLHERSTSES